MVEVIYELPVVAHGNVSDIRGAFKVVAVRAFEGHKVELEKKVVEYVEQPTF